MAFKQVFYALQEVFPQIDLRILKAVASEYSSDVDAAGEFVLSDVLPAVSEPTEAHYTLQHIDYARNDHTNSWSSGTFHGRTVSPGYSGPIRTYNNLEEYSLIKDKVVINETITTPTVDYGQVEASSTSAPKPPITDYEQSASITFVNQCAIEKGKTTPPAENVGNQKHFNVNCNLPDFFASSGSMLPLYTESPSDCAVKYKGHIHLKLPRAESTEDPESQDKYYLENLFASFYPTKDEHASVNSLGALTVHTLCASDDNYDLQALFEKEMPLKLCEAETVSHLSKSKDNCNLGTLFVGFCSNKDRETSDGMTNVPIFQTLPESEDNYDMQVLSEKGKSLKVSATQRIHDISRPQDNYGFQVLFENIDIAGKELDKLHTAESTPVLLKSEDNMYKESCASDSSAEVPRFFMKDENKKSSYKIDDKCTLHDLFVSSELVHNSSQIFEGKDDSCAIGCEEQPSTDFSNPVSLISICNFNDDFNFPELFSSPNIFPSNLDMQCEVRNGAEKKIICSESVDKYSIFPLMVHDTFPQNEIKLMPGPDKYEEFPDINAHSYQIAGINKLVSDITDSKEAQIVREEKSLLAALAQDLHARLAKLSTERDEAFTNVEEVTIRMLK